MSPPVIEPSLQAVILHYRELLESLDNAPTEKDIQEIFDTLYASSLLKEEGRPVRARVVLAPPSSFPEASETVEGVHSIRFSAPKKFTYNEIKRISPAASFLHSVVAIWPDGQKGIRIWGILNTGPEWINLVAGGRKTAGGDMKFPLVHVRDPGWLLFYHNYSLIAEWRGREFHGPRLDVFESKLLNERFIHLRRNMISSIDAGCLASTLDAEAYAELAHHISLQFIRRIINIVRTSGHGGSLVIMPEGERGIESSTRWIDCKYSVGADSFGTRFRQLLQAIIRRIGQLCPENSSAAEAWIRFRNSSDPELDRLEGAFFELARFFSDLMQVDGALVIDQRLRMIGFGGEIRVDQNVFQVGQAHDLDGTHVSSWNVQNDGTRHRAVYRLCAVEPEMIGFVISQDNQARMIANIEGAVTFWAHTVV